MIGAVSAFTRFPALVAQATAGRDPLGWEDVLRQDVAPVASAYILVLLLLAWYRRIGRRPSGQVASPPSSSHDRQVEPGPGFAALVRHLAGTVLGGYAAFLAIVVIFYFVLGGESNTFLVQALREGSVLAFLIVLPALLVFGWIEGSRSRRS